VTTQDEMRLLIAGRLDSHEAHVGFDRAVADLPEELRGVVPAGSAHSCWQLVEHLRRAQADILDFCVNPDYVYPTSMEEYWPDVAPRDDAEWQASITGFLDDVGALKQLALDESVDLFASVPRGNHTQTYARELLVAADHDAYHLGQLVSARRVLGCWRDAPGWG
jgi:uncharacterized damage-inducible protein DinB